MNLLSRNDFSNVINRLKQNDRFLDKLSDVLDEFGIDNQICSTGLEDVIIDILETIFDDKKSEWISYWIWELDYGEKYNDGDVADEDGVAISLRTPEDLYDFLLKEKSDNH